MYSVFWFRRDLRVEDNIGLYEALKSGRPVIGVFIFDENILSRLEDKKDARLSFIHQRLTHINEQFKIHKSRLLTFYGKPKEVWPEILKMFPVSHVYYNKDYEPYGKVRDKEIADFLSKKELQFSGFLDHLVMEPGQVLKDDGKPYTVYTPFSKKWLKVLKKNQLQSVSSESELSQLAPQQGLPTEKELKFLSLQDIGFESTELELPEPDVSAELLKEYEKKRDRPDLQATSMAGMHLRFGSLSPRQLSRLGQQHSKTWYSELIWREFFIHVLHYFPNSVTQCFKPKYEAVKWRNNKKEFQQWCEGKTGYPIVDAGMRELNQTGYMHNRVRMITASFLCKHLLIDWRWGERYFASKLLDFELASNVGNWQWAAGTGCDAAPYFRVFNPYTQQEKFDPDLDYIRKWVPEFETENYPEPMVEHKFARNRALQTYKSALN